MLSRAEEGRAVKLQRSMLRSACSSLPGPCNYDLALSLT